MLDKNSTNVPTGTRRAKSKACTVPSIETLAKYAQALEIPLYQLFYDGEEAPKKIKGLDLDGAKLSGGDRREIESLGRKFTKLKERDKGLVRHMIAKLARSKS